MMDDLSTAARRSTLINAGAFRRDHLFTVETRPDGAVVHPKPAAHERVGEIIAKGADAGHPAT